MNFQTFYYAIAILFVEFIFLILGYVVCFCLKSYPVEKNEIDIAFLKGQFWKKYFLLVYGMIALTVFVALLILIIHSIKGQ